jgi:uncharacterized protein
LIEGKRESMDDQGLHPQLNPKSLCQIEIQATNLERSQKFYADVFGWMATAAKLHEYVVLDVPKDCPFGVSLVPSTGGIGTTTQVVLYFSVTGAFEIAKRAELSGGAKKFGPTKLPGYGSIWQIKDPDGHTFGLFERQPPPNSKGL